jgi:hypothetical protein
MTRPTQMMALITAVAALIACGAGFALGRSSGEQKAPDLLVAPVEQIDRPVVGEEIPVPTPIAIPARLPK